MNKENELYKKEISILREKFDLRFTLNAGGGELYNETFGGCQIHLEDDKEDFIKLINWLGEIYKNYIEIQHRKNVQGNSYNPLGNKYIAELKDQFDKINK